MCYDSGVQCIAQHGKQLMQSSERMPRNVHRLILFFHAGRGPKLPVTLQHGTHPGFTSCGARCNRMGTTHPPCVPGITDNNSITDDGLMQECGENNLAGAHGHASLGKAHERRERYMTGNKTSIRAHAITCESPTSRGFAAGSSGTHMKQRMLPTPAKALKCSI